MTKSEAQLVLKRRGAWQAYSQAALGVQAAEAHVQALGDAFHCGDCTSLQACGAHIAAGRRISAAWDALGVAEAAWLAVRTKGDTMSVLDGLRGVMSKICAEGAVAYAAGQGMETNPYPYNQNSLNYSIWKQGYKEAARMARAAVETLQENHLR